MRLSRLYQGKSLGTTLGMYLFTNILSDMLILEAGRSKRSAISLRFVCKFFNFSEFGSGNLLKNYLVKTYALFNLNKSGRKIEKNHGHRTSVVGINDSTTNICRSKCKAIMSMNLSQIVSGDFKPNIST